MAATGKYIGLDSATLATMKTNLIAAHAAALLAASYSSRRGDSKTMADLTRIGDELAEVNVAQLHDAGTFQRVIYPDMSQGAG